MEKTFEEGELIVSANAYYLFEDTNEYLVTFDSEKKVLNFYNDDYSIYKSISNIFEDDQTSCLPSYITRHLFNSDDKLEFLAYMTGKDGIITAKIFNEDGETIEDFGVASSAYCIKLKDKIKLLINSYEISYDPNYSGVKTTSKLYSVPGTLK